MARRFTLGLYNSYDPKSFHEAMRRAAARAGPLCDAFDFHLALFGFPFDAYETKGGERPKPATPVDVARVLEEGTSIGQGGGHLSRLATAGRLHVFGFPRKGLPPQLGTPVLATRRPDPDKRIDAEELADILRTQPVVALVGLGPRGVPTDVHEMVGKHVELTGKGVSLETATAMGVLAGRVAEALAKPAKARVTADCIVVRDGQILLIRRGRPPFQGMWALPGGFVDPDEPVEETAVRELREETGLEGRVLRIVGVYSKPGRDPRGPTVSLGYLMDASGDPKGSDDAADARWFPIEAPPELAFDHDRILADVRTLPGR